MNPSCHRSVAVALLGTLLLVACGNGEPGRTGLSPAERAELQGTCAGRAVAEAAGYTRESRLHPVVVEVVNPDRYSGFISPDWEPTAVSETELVACITVFERALDTCEYTGGHRVRRVEYAVAVGLVAAKTGEKISGETFRSDPPTCPQTISSPYPYRFGSVPYYEVNLWLMAYVAR